MLECLEFAMTIFLRKLLFLQERYFCCTFASLRHVKSNLRLFLNVTAASRMIGVMASAVDGPSGCSSKMHNGETPFSPKKALVLTKFSRYEFEKRRHSDLTEDQLIKNLEERGSDYKNLLQHHTIHVRNRDRVVETLEKNGIETRLVNRFEYTDANIEWADVIFTTGGDGTYLMAASKIRNRDKPLIGINSDPSRSLGYLCLPSDYTENFPDAISKLRKGEFRWMYRHRIRVTLVGEHAFDQPIELHDQQLKYPEYRFLDCIEGHHKKGAPKALKTDEKSRHELPVRALNEVFIGESLSSRVSYYEFSIDGTPRSKLKSSGLTVCTGTGSTSWSFNINKVTEQCVRHLLKIANQEANVDIPVNNSELIKNITSKFNNSLIFDPTKQLMAYTIRDPVVFGTGFNCKPRGFAKKIEVKSRMFDACLVIDGGLSFVFNDGATATLEMYDEDALCTVTLTE